MPAPLSTAGCLSQGSMSNSLKLKSLSRTVPMAMLLLPGLWSLERTPATRAPMWNEARGPAAIGTRMPVPQPILDELTADRRRLRRSHPRPNYENGCLQSSERQGDSDRHSWTQYLFLRCDWELRVLGLSRT